MNETTQMLIVDDSPDNLLVLSSIVREFFPTIDIMTVSSAAEGLSFATEAKVDVALIDVQMPGMNGIEMCRVLKTDSRTKHIALILLTGYSADPKLKAMGLESGADDFINRPFDTVEFIARVKVILRIKEAEDNLRNMNERLEAQVTEKVAELREKEERFRSICLNSREWVWEVDGHGTFTYTHDAAEILGYTHEDLVGKKRFLDLIHPVGTRGLKSTTTKGMERKLSFRDVVYKVQNKQGATRWISISGFPISDMNGVLFGYRGSAIDVTLRKQAENLQRAQLRLIKYSISHTEQEFIQQFLAEAERLTESEMGFFNLLHEDEKTLSLRAWSKKSEETVCALVKRDNRYPVSQAGVWADCISQRKPLIHNDYASLPHKKGLPEGHATIVRELVVPVIRGDKITAVVGVGNKRDLYTDADVLALQRLADVGWETIVHKKGDAERALLQSAVECAAEGIVITDKAGLIQYVNPAFEEMTGFVREEALGQNPRLLQGKKEGTAFYLDLWATLLRGETWYGQFVNKKKDGTLYTEGARISPVFNTAGETTNYIAVKSDITHSLELEDQLRQSQKIQAIGQLAGGIAHDFNNILTIILGYGHLVMASLPEESRASHDVDKMVTAAQKAERLTRQLLAFSRKQVLKAETLNLNSVVTNFKDLLKKLLRENIQLDFHLLEQPVLALLDPTQAEQILVNLVVNARDAIGTKEGTIRISIGQSQLPSSIRENLLPDTLKIFGVITVEDDGCGIPEEVKDKIFDPFFTTKEQGRGTGLGLSTVYGIVKQSDGYLFVDSTLGTGTKVSIFLPEGSKKEKPEMAQASIIPAQKHSKKILVIDDEELVLSILEQTLTMAGHTVFVQNDPHEAFNLWEQKQDEIDLVITDVGMPGMNGVDLAKKMSAAKADVNILFISGYGELHTQGKSIGVIEYPFMQKPFTAEELLHKVESIFGAEAGLR